MRLPDSSARRAPKIRDARLPRAPSMNAKFHARSMCPITASGPFGLPSAARGRAARNGGSPAPGRLRSTSAAPCPSPPFAASARSHGKYALSVGVPAPKHAIISHTPPGRNAAEPSDSAESGSPSRPRHSAPCVRRCCSALRHPRRGAPSPCDSDSSTLASRDPAASISDPGPSSTYGTVNASASSSFPAPRQRSAISTHGCMRWRYPALIAAVPSCAV